MSLRWLADSGDVGDDGIDGPQSSPLPGDEGGGEGSAPSALSLFIDSSTATSTASLFSALAIILSLYEIYKHLQHYNRPLLQRQIVRIILIVPIYAAGSLLSLFFPHGALYFNTVRDIYEAYVIHSFLALMLDFPGGEPAVVLGEEYYESREWQYTLLVVYNISYTSALYGLLLFYMATKHLLKGFHAVGKFAAVKIIVFATYYQSLIVTAIPGMDTLGSSEKWNDFIICIEMFCFAVMHFYCFNHKEFLPGGAGMANANTDEEDAPVNLKTDTTFGAAMSRAADALSIKDILEDAARNFSSRYARYIMAGVEGGIVTEGRADHVMMQSHAPRPSGADALPAMQVVVVKEKELGTDKESLFATATGVVVRSTTNTGHEVSASGVQADDDDMYGLIVAVDGAADATEWKVAEPELPISATAHAPQTRRHQPATRSECGAEALTGSAAESGKRARAPSSSIAGNEALGFESNMSAVAQTSVAANKAALLAASAAAAAQAVQAAAKQRQAGTATDVDNITRSTSSGKHGDLAMKRRQGRQPPSAMLAATRAQQEDAVKFAGQESSEDEDMPRADKPQGIAHADEGKAVKGELLADTLLSPTKIAAQDWQPTFDDGTEPAAVGSVDLSPTKITDVVPVSLSERQVKASQRLQALKISASKVKVDAPVEPVGHNLTISSDPSTWEFAAAVEEETPLPTTVPAAAEHASEWHDEASDAMLEGGVVDFSKALTMAPEPVISSDTAVKGGHHRHRSEAAVSWDEQAVEFKTAPLSLKPPPQAGTARRVVQLSNLASIADATLHLEHAEASTPEAPPHAGGHEHAGSDARVAFAPSGPSPATSQTARRRSIEATHAAALQYVAEHHEENTDHDQVEAVPLGLPETRQPLIVAIEELASTAHAEQPSMAMPSTDVAVSASPAISYMNSQMEASAAQHQPDCVDAWAASNSDIEPATAAMSDVPFEVQSASVIPIAQSDIQQAAEMEAEVHSVTAFATAAAADDLGSQSPCVNAVGIADPFMPESQWDAAQTSPITTEVHKVTATDSVEEWTAITAPAVTHTGPAGSELPLDEWDAIAATDSEINDSAPDCSTGLHPFTASTAVEGIEAVAQSTEAAEPEASSASAVVATDNLVGVSAPITRNDDVAQADETDVAEASPACVPVDTDSATNVIASEGCLSVPPAAPTPGGHREPAPAVGSDDTTVPSDGTSVTEVVETVESHHVPQSPQAHFNSDSAAASEWDAIVASSVTPAKAIGEKGEPAVFDTPRTNPEAIRSNLYIPSGSETHQSTPRSVAGAASTPATRGAFERPVMATSTVRSVGGSNFSTPVLAAPHVITRTASRGAFSSQAKLPPSPVMLSNASTPQSVAGRQSEQHADNMDGDLPFGIVKPTTIQPKDIRASLGSPDMLLPVGVFPQGQLSGFIGGVRTPESSPVGELSTIDQNAANAFVDDDVAADSTPYVSAHRQSSVDPEIAAMDTSEAEALGHGVDEFSSSMVSAEFGATGKPEDDFSF